MGELVSIVETRVPVRAVLAIIKNAGAKEFTVDVQYVGHPVGLGACVETFEVALDDSAFAYNVRRCGTCSVSFSTLRPFGEINRDFRKLLSEAFDIDVSEVTIIAPLSLSRS